MVQEEHMAVMQESDVGASSRLYKNFDELSAIAVEWDTFIRLAGGDIYQTYDWCRIWWKYYGEGRALRVYIFRKGEKIVGILPFFVEVISIGPLCQRVAKVVGADFTLSIVNLAIEDDCSEIAIQIVLSDLIEVATCDIVLIGPLGENYEVYRRISQVAMLSASAFFFRDRKMSVYSQLTLPGTFHEYLQTLKRRERKRLRYSINLGQRSFDWSCDVLSEASQLENEIESFVRMHTEQWMVRGKLGHFLDWPHGIEFNAEMAMTQAKLGQLRLLRVKANDTTVSYRLGYAFGKRWHARLPARLVGSEWDKFGIGRVGMLKMIEFAASEGIREIESGEGHYKHKCDLGMEEYSLRTIAFVQPGILPRLKAKLYFYLADALNLFYYRIWYIKLAPRLPIPRKPLWKLWIKTRN